MTSHQRSSMTKHRDELRAFFQAFIQRAEKYTMFHGHELPEKLEIRPTFGVASYRDKVRVRMICANPECSADWRGEFDMKTGQSKMFGGAELTHCKW